AGPGAAETAREYTAAPPRPGLLDGLVGLAGGKLKELAETALNTLVTSARSSVEAHLPGLIDGTVGRFAARAEDAPAGPTLASRFETRQAAGS
ncbi:MAG: hypothetical protein K2V38_29495, partial [Gemmataceae bacterium]|nr:hypothetical protein [Gemmataceae bacterium]